MTGTKVDRLELERMLDKLGLRNMVGVGNFFSVGKRYEGFDQSDKLL